MVIIGAQQKVRVLHPKHFLGLIHWSMALGAGDVKLYSLNLSGRLAEPIHYIIEVEKMDLNNVSIKLLIL
jgi:hypothetical protein